MRLTIAFLAATLLLSGFAIAGPPQGDETAAIDLTAIPGGPMLFLKCSRSNEPTNCGLVSLWQQSNGVPGLQTITKPYGGQPRPMDKLLLG